MESSARFGWWPILHLVVALSAIAHGLIIVLVWVANLAVAKDPLAMEAMRPTMLVLGWVEIVLSMMVIAGLAVGTWLHRPLWARGVAAVIVGMVLHWGWWLVDRRFDLFGTGSLVEGDPQLVARLAARLWVMLGVDAVAVILLALGGALLLWHRPRPAAVTDEDIAEGEDEPHSPQAVS